MKKKFWVLLAVLATAALVIFVLRSRRPMTDEARIQRQFAELIELLEKDGDETPVRLHSITRNMPNFFENPSRIMISEAGLRGEYSPRELASHAIRLRAGFDEVRLSVHDLIIEIPEDGLAEAGFTLEADGSYAGERIRDFFEVKAKLKIVEDQWLFSDVEIVGVLRR